MNVHSHHPSQHPVGRHPDRPAHSPMRQSVRQTEEPSHQAEGGFSSILRRYPLVLGITLSAAVLLTLAAATVLYSCPDPTRWILPASLLSLALTSLCGGIAAGRTSPAAPVAAGVLAGGILSGLFLLLTLVFGEGEGLLPWGMGSGMLLLHLVGSVLSRPRKKRPTHGSHPTRR